MSSTQASPNHDESYSTFCKSWRVRLKDRRIHPFADEYWPQCVRVDGMSREELLTLQSSRLQDLVDHAVAHVPYYRQWAKDSGYSVGDRIKLESLPVLSKTDYLPRINDFQSDAFPLREMGTGKTSGSSGVPFELRQHGRSKDYSYCCLWRAFGRYGLRPGDRRVYLWGRRSLFNAFALSAAKSKARYRLRDWFNTTLSIDAYVLNDTNVAASLADIEQFRPTYMHGYVSALYTLAQHLLAQGKTLEHLNLRLVATESEKLYDFQKEAMAKAFQCPVFECYGSVEMGNISEPAPDGIMRINEDLVLFERQETGHAVVTNLFSHAFPFIRYAQGDVIEQVGAPTGGLPYMTLDGIVGRSVDLIPVKAGGHTPGRALSYVIDAHMKHIIRYQIHQLSLDRVIVRIVPRATLPENVERTIRKDLQGILGEETRIDFEIVKEIKPAASGKYRWVISDIAGSAPGAAASNDDLVRAKV